MRSNLDHIMQAVARATKQNAKRAVPAKQHVQQIQKVNSNAITNIGNVITNAKTATTKLSEEQYKSFIIALAIEHIKKRTM